MTLYTIGYLGKLQYEAMEGVHNAPLESGMAMGLTHSEQLFHVVIPESSNHLLSQLLFMFEYNVRHGAVLGLVGAGGIGMYIDNYINPPFDYNKAFALTTLSFLSFSEIINSDSLKPQSIDRLGSFQITPLSNFGA